MKDVEVLVNPTLDVKKTYAISEHREYTQHNKHGVYRLHVHIEPH